MSKFTEEDWAGLASMGNENFNRDYLARLNTREYPTPTGNDINKLKEFIRQKYMDKKWHVDGVHATGGAFATSTAATSNSAAGHNTTASAGPEDTGKINIKLGSRPVSYFFF